MSLTRVQGGLFGTGGGANTAMQLGVAIVESANTVYNNYTLTTQQRDKVNDSSSTSKSWSN